VISSALGLKASYSFTRLRSEMCRWLATPVICVGPFSEWKISLRSGPEVCVLMAIWSMRWSPAGLTLGFGGGWTNYVRGAVTVLLPLDQAGISGRTDYAIVWCWRPVSESELPSLLVDKDGEQREWSVPAYVEPPAVPGAPERSGHPGGQS